MTCTKLAGEEGGEQEQQGEKMGMIRFTLVLLAAKSAKHLITFDFASDFSRGQHPRQRAGWRGIIEIRNNVSVLSLRNLNYSPLIFAQLTFLGSLCVRLSL